MPLYQELSLQDTTILIWKYDETDVLNMEKLLPPEQRERVNAMHPKKQCEHLMVRQMLKLKLPQHQIVYEDNGQPRLSPEDFKISITHSFPWAAVAIATQSIGIDWEKTQSKILNIKHKFLTDREQEWLPSDRETEYLTVIWAIKEALYKLHPSKYWSLKKHYEVEPFSLNDLSSIQCCVFDEQFTDVYTAKVSPMEDGYFAVVGYITH